MDEDDAIGGLALRGGPLDGGEIERDMLGGRLPGVIAAPVDGRVAHYVADIDAGGSFYQFFGFQPRTAAEADAAISRAYVERARERAAALAGEAREMVRQSRALRLQALRLVGERRQGRPPFEPGLPPGAAG